MGGLAVEVELRADRGVVHEPVARRKAVADVQEKRDIGVSVEARAHQERPAHDLLLGRAERDRDAAGNVEALHRLLDRIGGADGDAGMGVVAFHVAGRPVDQRLVVDGERRLRAAGQRIDLRDDDDLRLAGAPMRPDVGIHPGGAGLDGEADRLEHAFDELRALDFLHAELAEIVDGVADVRDLVGIAIDRGEGERLACIGLRAGRTGEQRDAECEGCGKISSHHVLRARMLGSSASGCASDQAYCERAAQTRRILDAPFKASPSRPAPIREGAGSRQQREAINRASLPRAAASPRAQET